MKHGWMKYTEKIGCILLGNALMAVGVAGFLAPGGFITGGSTGLALLLNRMFGLDASLALLLINGGLFLVGGLVLGWRFVSSTAASVVCYPAMLAVAQRVPGIDRLTEEPLLTLVAAGVLVGMGTGFIVRVGGSTGGSDTIGLILHKWIHLSLARLVFGVDLLILLVQFVSATAADVFHSVLLLALMTLSMNQVLVRGKSQVQLLIITKDFESLRQRLLKELSVGVTLFSIETGYEEKRQQAVLCVIPHRKLYQVEEAVQQLDPEAFITVSEIKEVRGQGFTLPRMRREAAEARQEQKG